MSLKDWGFLTATTDKSCDILSPTKGQTKLLSKQHSETKDLINNFEYRTKCWLPSWILKTEHNCFLWLMWKVEQKDNDHFHVKCFWVKRKKQISLFSSPASSREKGINFLPTCITRELNFIKLQKCGVAKDFQIDAISYALEDQHY